MNAISPIIILTALLVPIIGAFLAINPWIQRRSAIFGVAVPDCAHADPDIIRAKRTQSAAMGALTAIATIATFAGFYMGDDQVVMGLIIASIVSLPIAELVVMQLMRRRVIAIKDARGWESAAHKRTSVVTGEDIPEPLPLSLELINLLPILATLLLVTLGYASFPEHVPMQINYAGDVITTVDKSPLVAAFPVFLEVFIAGTFLVTHLGIIRSKRAIDPDQPVSSAYAYGLFARSQSIFTLAGGFLFNCVMICLPLTMVGIMPILQAAIVVFAVTMLLAIGSIALSLIYGQSGSRIMGRADELACGVATDDDEHWKWGLLYFDADDPAVFLPKRYGVGWTVNYARPLAWVLLVAMIVVTTVLVVVTLSL